MAVYRKPKTRKKAAASGRKSPHMHLVVLIVLAAVVVILLVAMWMYYSTGMQTGGKPASEPPSSAASTTPPASLPSISEVTSQAEQPDFALPTPGLPKIPLSESPFTQEARARLDAFLNSQHTSVSVYILDIATGDEYKFNDTSGYYCASTLKAPYALWLAARDEAGEIDLNALLPGESTTGWDNIYTMISKSSNGATHRLSTALPANVDTGFNTFVAELGFCSPDGCELVESGIHGWCRASDGAKAMRALYDYFETGSANAQTLKQAFVDATHTLLWCPTTAAKKYGSWDASLHDMAIVYAERPYIISVFTDWGNMEEAFPEEGREMMQQLGRLAAEVMGAA